VNFSKGGEARGANYKADAKDVALRTPKGNVKLQEYQKRKNGPRRGGLKGQAKKIVREGRGASRSKDPPQPEEEER